MSLSRREVLAWEERWSLRSGLAALGAVVLVLAAVIIASSVVGNGDGDASFLREVDRHRGGQLLSSSLQAIGLALLALPLLFLFRAAKARSTTMRSQLIGLVVAAPIFLGLAAIFGGITNLEAATDFLAKEVVGTGDRANEIASDAIVDSSLRPLSLGFGLAGQFGFVFAMFYTCLHAMRVGLLPRFWGSLGMALGAVSFIFFQLALLWFVYLGLLLLGRVPGGRPPAWETGEAIPWPTPAEKAAADLSPTEDSPASENPSQAEDPPASSAEDPEKRTES